jgi:hypothetical protein
MPPVLLQDEFFAGRPRTVDALDYLADAPAEARGAIHTRPEVAAFILDLTGWSSDHDLTQARLLEPSAGEGDFLLPAVERLLSQTKPGDATRILPCIRAVEVNTSALATCRKRLTEIFRKQGWRTPQIRSVLDTWLLQADFLTVPLEGDFTHIVGNPPYVRLENLPKELLQVYRARWASLFDRADLYVAFIERSLDLLASEGKLGFICADRWMKNRYGGPLRAKVAQGYHLDVVVDFTGCPAFFDEVDAYPAVSVIRRGKGDSTRLAFRPEISEASLQGLSKQLLGHSTNGVVKIRRGITQGSQPWMFNEDGMMEILRGLESRFPLLEATGCKVGIGVATGADAVFIGSEEELNVEPERRLPLVMTKDIRDGRVEWRGQWVLNPFEEDGSLVDPARYPKFRAYIGKHRAAIQKRNVAGRNPRGWFRTIDRIHTALTHQPKLLIPDIKGKAHVVYERGRYYPHHNLYYVVSEEWDLHALRTVLSSRVARAFVAAYCPKMRGGFLRFQAQYLRRIRLPRWETLDLGLRKKLILVGKSPDPAVEEDLVREVYGLKKSEWEALLPGKGA